MDEIDKLLAQIRANGDDVWEAGPQPEAAVAELEQALDIRLPATYRAFLGRFGMLGLAGSFISGIGGGEPLREETGWMYGDTQRLRETAELPSHLLVIQADEDAPYCLDTSVARADGEYPVVCYEPDCQHSERMADSFGEWLVGSLRLQAEE